MSEVSSLSWRGGEESEEQPPYRDVKQFQSGLVFKALRLLHHSTLGLRVIKKKRRNPDP